LGRTISFLKKGRRLEAQLDRHFLADALERRAIGSHLLARGQVDLDTLFRQALGQHQALALDHRLLRRHRHLSLDLLLDQLDVGAAEHRQLIGILRRRPEALALERGQLLLQRSETGTQALVFRPTHGDGVGGVARAHRSRREGRSVLARTSRLRSEPKMSIRK
jgi:hypothetical protein